MNRSVRIPAGLAAVVLSLLAPATAPASQETPSGTDAMSTYQSESARGNEPAALAALLDYTVRAYGEDAPEAVQVTRR